MKITNETDLPAIIRRAVEKDAYEGPLWSEWPSRISVTTLVGPARIAALKTIHEDNISIDVKDCVFMLKGRTVHSILEQGKGPGDITELRLEFPVSGSIVSGQLDHWNDGILTDWKNSDKRWDVAWEQQLNCLDFLCKTQGIDVTRLQVCAIRRGWIETIPVVRWTRDQQWNYLTERVLAHQAATFELPECTDTETWNTRRCQKWCLVAPFCQQWKALDKGKERK